MPASDEHKGQHDWAHSGTYLNDAIVTSLIESVSSMFYEWFQYIDAWVLMSYGK